MPGDVIGDRFRIERLLGKGGMGEVYAATHTTTGKQVAIKLIHSELGAGQETTRRFLREAKAATAIQHPNVIEVFDVFADDDGTPVMVMELLEGEPFSAYRERAGALPLHEVATIMLPVVGALRAAHDKGIVHRDLKPDNIFLATSPSGERRPTVLDFGIAKVIDPTKIGGETQGGATRTGSILGTPYYMAYEQAMSDKTIDHRADIWAIGVIVFEALCGRRPMEFDSLGQMYAAFLQGAVPSVREFVPELPSDVSDVIDRCLQKQRDTRLSDLQPLADVLNRYTDPNARGAMAGGVVRTAAVVAVEGAAVLSSSLSTVPKRRPWLLAGGAAALLVVGIVSVAGLLKSSPPTPAVPNATSTPATANAVSPTGEPSATLPSVANESASAPAQPPASAANPRAAATRPIASAPASSVGSPTSAPAATTTVRGISEKAPY